MTQHELMKFSKELRILPSCVAHVLKGSSDLPTLRSKVKREITLLSIDKEVILSATHSGTHRTIEVLALDRKIEQLSRWLEATE